MAFWLFISSKFVYPILIVFSHQAIVLPNKSKSVSSASFYPLYPDNLVTKIENNLKKNVQVI
jgi:hypothetical protein